MEVTEAPQSMIWQTRLPASWLVLYAQSSYVGQLKDDSERTHLCTRPPTKNVTFQHSEGHKSHPETTKACCPCTVFIFISCVLCVCMHKQRDQSTSEQLPLGRNQPPLGHRWYIWLSRVCQVTKNSHLEMKWHKIQGHHQRIRRGIVERERCGCLEANVVKTYYPSVITRPTILCNQYPLV